MILNELEICGQILETVHTTRHLNCTTQFIDGQF